MSTQIQGTEARVQRETALPPSAVYSVLLAEDDGQIRELCVRWLEREGFSVQSTGDGAEAWKLLQRQFFNLLITDNEMPGLTGVQIISKMLAGGMELPVILTSGDPSVSQAFGDGKSRGCVFLVKPYKAEILISLARMLCTGRSRDRTEG